MLENNNKIESFSSLFCDQATRVCFETLSEEKSTYGL